LRWACSCARLTTVASLLIEVGYATGLRVSELVALKWADVIERRESQVQIDVLGKGGKRRQVLLPEIVSRSLLSLRGDAQMNTPSGWKLAATVRKGQAVIEV
jgi:site-specific recombinase XerD